MIVRPLLIHKPTKLQELSNNLETLLLGLSWQEPLVPKPQAP